MKRFSIVLVALLFTVGLSAKEEKFRKNEKKVPEQYIVVLTDDVAEEDVDSVAVDLAGRHAGLVERVYSKAIKGFAVKMSEGMARKLAEHPAVEYVEEDGEVSIDTTQSGATWGLDRIDQRD